MSELRERWELSKGSRGLQEAWIAEAGSFIDSVFPPHHSVRRRWEVALNKLGLAQLHSVHGVFAAACQLIQDDHLETLADNIRAETVMELLDQAEALLPQDRVAAAVLAGGALETHLRHLCQRNKLGWNGQGAISKYDQAIAQARGSQLEVYSKDDSKWITAWAGLRNQAAHEPLDFKTPAEEVRLMVKGIRSFVARVP